MTALPAMMLAAAPLPRITLPHLAWGPVIPEVVMAGGAVVLVTAAALLGRRLHTWVYACGAIAASLGAMGWTWWGLWDHVERHGSYTAMSGALAVDGFSLLVFVLVEASVVLGSLVAVAWLDREGIGGPEFYVLAMISASGAMFMAAANDLIMIFLGLEILSIPLYILAGFNHRRADSGEAAMKYFILGAFSSAIFVYGIALTYGATGTTNLAHIANFLARNVVTDNGLLLAGLALLLVGFGFKVAAVPFHAWTPDVYQGSPSPATGFMAAVAKAGGFAALLRVFFSTFSTLRLDWQPAIWLLAVLTLIVGAVLAVVQTDIKRMMAYSSINHAGFVLVGLYAATTRGISGSLYYLFVYAFMIIGTFAVITVIGGDGDGNHQIEAYRGLGRYRPVVALCLTVMLVAQAGVPFTTGFLAKIYVISAVAEQHAWALAVIAMVSSVVAAFFYLRVVVVMYTPRGSGMLQLAVAGWTSDAGRRRLGNGGPAPSGGEVPEGALTPAGAGQTGTSGLSPASAAGPGSVPAAAPGPSTGPDPAPAEGASASAAVAPGAGVPAGEATVAPSWPRMPLAVALVLVITVAFTVVFGFFPAPVIDFARHATLLF